MICWRNNDKKRLAQTIADIHRLSYHHYHINILMKRNTTEMLRNVDIGAHKRKHICWPR